MSVVAVVDDDDDLRDLMVMRLRSSGYEVHDAANGVDGLDLVRGLRPDLVIVDWMMPGMTGIEVCRAVRADEELADTPILMVTSRASESDRTVGLAAGATSVMAKPFALGPFLELVQSLVQTNGALTSV